MSSCFFVDVSEDKFTKAILDVSEGDSWWWNASYANCSIIVGSALSSSVGGHVYNGKNNPFSYDVSRIRVRGEVYTSGIEDTYYNCFYVILYKTIIKSNRQPNLSLLTNGSRMSDFFLYEQPNCVLVFKTYRIGDDDYSDWQSIHFDISCNKHVFVRPDEVVGVHYCWFTQPVVTDEPPDCKVEASAEVKFGLA